MMVTFADGQKPPVITAVEEAKIPHSAFFKFNNSALFADIEGGDDNIDKMFWRMGINSSSLQLFRILRVSALL